MKREEEERKKQIRPRRARRLPAPMAVRRRSGSDFHPACPSRARHFSTPPLPTAAPNHLFFFFFHCPA